MECQNLCTLAFGMLVVRVSNINITTSTTKGVTAAPFFLTVYGPCQKKKKSISSSWDGGFGQLGQDLVHPYLNWIFSFLKVLSETGLQVSLVGLPIASYGSDKCNCRYVPAWKHGVPAQ